MKIPLIAGIIGFIVAIVDAVILQKIHTINSVFLMYEGFAIISLCLYSFYKLAILEVDLIASTKFWFTTIFLVYWSSVFVYWGMYPFFLTLLKPYHPFVNLTLRIITILSYLGFAIIFLNYKKLTKGE